MDQIRVREILNSKDNISVLYRGLPVWIEGVSDNNIAEITQLNENRSRIEVPVSMLEEKG